jgi:hypothetical protein
MRKLALVTAAVLAVSAAAVGVFVATRSEGGAKPPPAPPGPSPHGASMDDDYASVLAMYRAPEGATPCESAHNAFTAEAEAARSLGRESHFAFVADRAAFLAGCEGLAPEARPCLAPRYRARHRDACEQALPPVEALSHMFVARGDLEGEDDPLAKEPGFPR